jgi:hypothetical protein
MMSPPAPCRRLDGSICKKCERRPVDALRAPHSIRETGQASTGMSSVAGDREAGLVAFGSTDLSSPIDGYLRQSQVAVGGLIGRSFGPAILQAYLTTDVYQKNYGGQDTRLWGRVILPLWTAPTAPPVATPLYRK